MAWSYHRDWPISGGPGAIYRRSPGWTVERWDGRSWVEVDWRAFSRRIEGGDPTLDDISEDRASRLPNGPTVPFERVQRMAVEITLGMAKANSLVVATPEDSALWDRLVAEIEQGKADGLMVEFE